MVSIIASLLLFVDLANAELLCSGRTAKTEKVKSDEIKLTRLQLTFHRICNLIAIAPCVRHILQIFNVSFSSCVNSRIDQTRQSSDTTNITVEENLTLAIELGENIVERSVVELDLLFQ